MSELRGRRALGTSPYTRDKRGEENDGGQHFEGYVVVFEVASKHKHSTLDTAITEKLVILIVTLLLKDWLAMCPHQRRTGSVTLRLPAI